MWIETKNFSKWNFKSTESNKWSGGIPVPCGVTNCIIFERCQNYYPISFSKSCRLYAISLILWIIGYDLFRWYDLIFSEMLCNAQHREKQNNKRPRDYLSHRCPSYYSSPSFFLLTLRSRNSENLIRPQWDSALFWNWYKL